MWFKTNGRGAGGFENQSSPTGQTYGPEDTKEMKSASKKCRKVVAEEKGNLRYCSRRPQWMLTQLSGI